MKELIRDISNLELMPPDCHCQNIAEMAIKTFKQHVIIVLASVSDNFPLYLWNLLLPQAEVTLNLLQKSNMTPKVWAYAPP